MFPQNLYMSNQSLVLVSSWLIYGFIEKKFKKIVNIKTVSTKTLKH